MKITIETDTEGEKGDAVVLEHVTQFILAGSLQRRGVLPGRFTHLHVGDVNDLIGMTAVLKEHLRDHKAEKSCR